MPASLPQRPSGAQTVYDMVRAQIIDGTLAPDVRLTEPVLAQHLGVSRTPVREALRLLTAEGLVQQQLTGGIRVAPMRRLDLERIFDVRGRLEGLMAHDACVRMDERGRTELEELFDLMDRMRGHHRAVLDLGRQFHEKIGEHADNPWCSHLLHQLRAHVDRFRAASTGQPGRAADTVTEHHQVFEAVISGDAERAERTMRAHIDRSAEVAARALILDDPAEATTAATPHDGEQPA